MRTLEKTKEQLIMELAKLRARVYELETIEAKKIEEHLNQLEKKISDMTNLLNGSEAKVSELRKRISLLERKEKRIDDRREK